MNPGKGEPTVGPIQREVPIPPKWESQFGIVRLAIQEMQPGDCRDIDGELRSVSSSILTAAKRLNYKVTTRKINGAGIRVWRIS